MVIVPDKHSCNVDARHRADATRIAEEASDDFWQQESSWLNNFHPLLPKQRIIIALKIWFMLPLSKLLNMAKRCQNSWNLKNVVTPKKLATS